jgi:valyl-tRNA synthetase
VEIAKLELRAAETENEREAIRTNLAWVFEHTLRLLHPMAPFVTEELWQAMVGRRNGAGRPALDGSVDLPASLAVAPWPATTGARDPECETLLGEVFDLVRGVRNLRSEYRVDPGRWVPATIVTPNAAFYRRMAPIVEGLPETRLRPIEVREAASDDSEQAVTVVAGRAVLSIPLAGMIDIAQERARLEGERSSTMAEIDRAEALLSRPGFVEKARPDVVAREREKLAGLKERLDVLAERLRALS